MGKMVARIAVLGTAFILAALIGIVVWRTYRSLPPTAVGDLPEFPAVRAEDFQALLAHPAFASLVPLAPPVAPTAVGNPNPFASVHP